MSINAHSATDSALAALLPDCPTWCRQHLFDELGGNSEVITHVRRVQVGEMWVEVCQMVDPGPADPHGPIVYVDHVAWVSGCEVRDLAAALQVAADLVPVAQPSPEAPLT